MLQLFWVIIILEDSIDQFLPGEAVGSLSGNRNPVSFTGLRVTGVVGVVVET